MKKIKIFMFVTVVVITILIFGVVVNAETTSGSCGNNISWNLDENGVFTISGQGELAGWDNLPPWFNIKKDIKTVIIDKRITAIGSRAFYNCLNMTSVIIPDGVTTIGKEAFYWCYDLQA